MKTLRNSLLLKRITILAMVILIYSSCKKGGNDEYDPKGGNGHPIQTKFFSSEVAQKWLDLQLRILRTPTTVNPYGRHGHRFFAYCSIGLYESVVPGMPSYQSLDGQLISMPQMPNTEPGKAYHWPTSANAALAYLNKHFFTAANTSAENIAALDSLENALNAQYQLEINNAAAFQRSKDFGTTVAERIFTWSTTDGSNLANAPYTPNGGIGSWTNTAPNPTGIAEPYWSNNRSFVAGVAAGTASPPPPAYSTDPNSAYYAMVKEVYDVSQALTPEQTATALYFRDNPGYPNGINNISTFSQVMHIENFQLDQFALAQAKTGIALSEAMINCWQQKYSVLQDRPTRYIRNVLGHTSWTPLLAVPPHPEYPSAHSQFGGSVAAVLTSILGENYQFTLHTYDYMGMAPRTYNSFRDLAVDAGKSRVYAGIHFTYSVEEGRKQGERIAANVLNKLKFKK